MMRFRIAALFVLAGAAIIGLVFTIGLWWPRPVAIGPDIAPPLAPGTGDGTFTIVVLGTSLTERYDWPSRLEKHLTGCLEEPVRVVSVARGGATSRWGAKQLSRVAALSPDLVLIEFAINDADLRRGLSLTNSMRLHRSILRDLSVRVPGAKVVLMSMSPAWGLKRLLRPRLERYYSLYPDLANTNGAGFIDLFQKWMAYPNAVTAFPDGVHPTEEATGEVIIPALMKYINGTHMSGTRGTQREGCPRLLAE